MSFLVRNKVLRLATVSLSAVAAFSLAIPANAALTNYGPPPPPPHQPPPGGFNCILTSRTIHPWGGRIGPLSDGALRITVTIPPYTFPVPVQVTITEPYSRFGACQGVPVTRLHCFRLIGGVGIEVTLANAFYGLFPRRIQLRIGRINVSGFEFEEVGVVGGNGHVTVVGARRHEGPITIGVRTSEVLGVFVKTRRHFHLGGTTSRQRHGNGDAVPPGELLTAALLPAGSRLPGLGVLAAAEAGSLLSAPPADARPPR
jgi:hypothetical protein